MQGSLAEHPQLANDLFLDALGDRLELLHKDHQVAVRKRLRSEFHPVATPETGDTGVPGWRRMVFLDTLTKYGVFGA